VPLEIVLTREDANSDSALLVEWLADEGEHVRKGQVVCVIETSKSAIEIEAPDEGRLHRLAEADQEVELGGAIAQIAADEAELAELQAARASAPPAPAPAGPANVTRKAAELAARHGIDPATIRKAGFVTVEDVEALLAERVRDEGGAAAGPLTGISLEGVTLPAVFSLDEAVGVLDRDFVSGLRADPGAFRALSSDEKLAALAGAGAAVGKDVRIGEGSLVVADRVVLEDGVEIGAGVTIACDEAVCIGALALFRDRAELSCRRAFVGEAAYVARVSRIGGGGAHDPQGIVVLGDLAYVGDEAFVNPCRPVVVGREVFVTMRSVLVTHNIGHSLLEGFENRFAPIVLEDRAQIGIGTVVYAGCRVGRDAIVGSNSYVVSDIPPGRLALGVPAKAVGAARHEPSPERQRQAATRIVAELRELLELRGHAVSDADEGFAVDLDGAPSQVLLVDRLAAGFEPPAVAGETVVLTLALAGEPPAGVATVDLLERRLHGSGGVLLESVREFLRKRGIRLEPGPWRYRGGLV
jgi:acetyltransferase-like isoleucine patch superfamily enzyme